MIRLKKKDIFVMSGNDIRISISTHIYLGMRKIKPTKKKLEKRMNSLHNKNT